VTSVSLQPPMILVCPAKSSTTWPRIRAAGQFCVNVMAEPHVAVTRQFSTRDADRYAGVAHSPRPTGPGLEGAVAWIECRINAEHDAGDHTIVVADVIAVDAIGQVEPLVFFRGRYGTFDPR
jgi:3-hydroxy-9,10-secoandrosta-1,3,5(10)-triene-9,17-dione monooxygenase reductase component